MVQENGESRQCSLVNGWTLCSDWPKPGSQNVVQHDSGDQASPETPNQTLWFQPLTIINQLDGIKSTWLITMVDPDGGGSNLFTSNMVHQPSGTWSTYGSGPSTGHIQYTPWEKTSRTVPFHSCVCVFFGCFGCLPKFIFVGWLVVGTVTLPYLGIFPIIVGYHKLASAINLLTFRSSTIVNN